MYKIRLNNMDDYEIYQGVHSFNYKIFGTKVGTAMETAY